MESLLGSNTLALYENPSNTAVKSFITLILGVDALNLIRRQSLSGRNKLECLTLARFFRQVQYAPPRYAPPVLTNNKLARKNLTQANGLDYPLSTMKKKGFMPLTMKRKQPLKSARWQHVFQLKASAFCMW